MLRLVYAAKYHAQANYTRYPLNNYKGIIHAYLINNNRYQNVTQLLELFLAYIVYKSIDNNIYHYNVFLCSK